MELNEKCAVVGIYHESRQDVSRLAFFCLFALQHRGQEASGITTSNGRFHTHKGAGLVSHVYTEESIKKLHGNIGVGHNRYSTSLGGALLHAQPVVNSKENFALAHNGNLPSTRALEDFLSSKNMMQIDHSDSELIADAIDVCLLEGHSIEKSVEIVFPLITGSFSITMMTRDTLIAIRDHYGMRPLCIGTIDGGYIIASETCALKTVGAKFLREVEPGEMILIDKQGFRSIKLAEPNPKHDVFEFVYFSRPDSTFAGRSIHDVRENFGKRLVKEFLPEADIVVPVPDTAVPVAACYAQESGIPFKMAIVKNRYINRTFIEPDQKSREHSVAMKLIPIPEVLSGKRVIVIDDSIVRGTTSKKLVKALFESGAVEVHLIISSPPIRFPDFYGIDTPRQSELIASSKTVEEIRDYLGATSLHFLSLEGLIESIGLPKENLCTSFFTGEYPIEIYERRDEISYNIPGTQTGN